jgi:ubiquinone/menaquinone biosynthesis C-methylase UbiE
MNFLRKRNRQPEWMDAIDADPAALSRSLAFIRWINSLLGYTRATISHLDRLSQDHKPGKIIKILDVATGSGDLPQAILRWAHQRGFDVKITAVDLHEATIFTASQLNADRRIQFIRADATRLPFADGEFDYVLTSMFLHHLEEQVAVTVLKEIDRVAAYGVIAADLLRSRRAYCWITLFTLFANPMVRHDARVSVAGAFTREELLALCNDAGFNYLKPHRHFGHRVVFSGVKR